MIKHLFSVKLRQIPSLEIACHPEATHFSCESGEIKFYRVNPHPSSKMGDIPRGTNILEFANYRRYGGWIDYGTINFISHQGNILKTEHYTTYYG